MYFKYIFKMFYIKISILFILIKMVGLNKLLINMLAFKTNYFTMINLNSINNQYLKNKNKMF